MSGGDVRGRWRGGVFGGMGGEKGWNGACVEWGLGGSGVTGVDVLAHKWTKGCQKLGTGGGY